MKTQHASLSPERWRQFRLDQQILMIANEMNRAAGLYLLEEPDPARHKAAFKCLLQFRPEAAKQIPLLLS